MSPKSKIRYVGLSYSKHTKIFQGHVNDHKSGQNTQSLGCLSMQERVRDFAQNFNSDDDFVSKQKWSQIRRCKLQLRTGKFKERDSTFTKMAEPIKNVSPPFCVVVVLLDDGVVILHAMQSAGRGELRFNLIDI